MAAGDHIYVHRTGYTHHGIDCGDGHVIHYTGEVGQKARAEVRRTTMRTFAKGGQTHVVGYDRCDTPAVTLGRARSRIGERAYDLVFNNCEHFARWCRTGEHHSEQVKDVASSAAGSVGTGAATAGALGIVSAGGAVAGLSGAGTMSGLAAVGGAVGGGAVAGIAALGAAPAAVATVAMHSVLADDPALKRAEREARKAGRVATVAGGVAGTAAAVGAVSAAGTAGLSAVGITSGLAAIGGTVGGGMVAGVAVTVAAPAVAAAALGYGIYKFFGGGDDE